MLQFISTSNPASTWNNTLASITTLVPFSFNPSLFFFYQKHYDWKPFYLVIYHEDEIIALLPLVYTGKAWVSLPHFSYGGLMGIGSGVNNKSELIRNVIAEIKKQGLDSGFYEVRNIESGQIEENSKENYFIRAFDNQKDNDFYKSEKVTMLLDLDNKVDDLYNQLSSNLRRKIKKASGFGFTIKKGGIELLNDFHKVYTRNILNLKSIGYGKQFFKDLFSVWQYGEITFFVAYHNNKPVGATLLASYQGFFENLYFATLSDFRKYYISDWLHWQMITHSFSNLEDKTKQKRPSIYSFGRSTEFSSVYTYKQHWPVTTLPLYLFSNLNDVRQNKWVNKSWHTVPGKFTQPLWPKLIKHIY